MPGFLFLIIMIMTMTMITIMIMIIIITIVVQAANCLVIACIFCKHKCIPTSSEKISFALLSFQSGSKSVNKRQDKNHLSSYKYLGICASHSEFRSMY